MCILCYLASLYRYVLCTDVCVCVLAWRRCTDMFYGTPSWLVCVCASLYIYVLWNTVLPWRRCIDMFYGTPSCLGVVVHICSMEHRLALASLYRYVLWNTVYVYVYTVASLYRYVLWNTVLPWRRCTDMFCGTPSCIGVVVQICSMEHSLALASLYRYVLCVHRRMCMCMCRCRTQV